jgi:hypothetical protein
MAATALAAGVNRRAARAPPRLSLAWVIAIAALAAAGTSCGLALMSEIIGVELGEPVIAGLTVWLTLSSVLCGLLVWRRRPKRFRSADDRGRPSGKATTLVAFESVEAKLAKPQQRLIALSLELSRQKPAPLAACFPPYAMHSHV